MSAIQVRGLRKSYGGPVVLDGLDLSVPDGSLTAVLGASGCGKTTLLRILAGFEPADAGEVRLGGELVDGHGRRVPPERRRIGYVPQEGALFPHLSVADNVGFGLRRGRERTARVHELLGLLGLAGLEARRPQELSGGQQQRVALARALAPQPRLVLLDEPFSALDPSRREDVRDDVRAALTIVGATALLVTHDQEEAFSLADQVAVLRDGHIVQSGSPRSLYCRPADADVADFLGDVNLMIGTLGGGQAETPLGTLRLADPNAGRGRAEGLVLIRPEELRLRPAAAGGDGMIGRVDDITFYGHDARVILTLEEPVPGFRLVARVGGFDVPGVGARVHVDLPDAVHLMPVPDAAIGAGLDAGLRRVPSSVSETERGRGRRSS